VPEDRPSDWRLVGELVLSRVRLRRADDRVLDRLLGVDVAQPNAGPDAHDVGLHISLFDHAGALQPLLERGDAVLEHGLLVLGVVVLGVLRDVAELTRLLDALGDLPALHRREMLDLVLQLGMTLRGENHFLQHKFLHRPRKIRTRRPREGVAAHHCSHLVKR
jgi:hypothetical protein